MSDDASKKKKKPRWLRRWLLRLFLAMLASIAVSAVMTWLWLREDEADGLSQLAAVVAETDDADPRWRWEQMEADLPSLADGDNSMLVLRKFSDSLGRWQPAQIALPDGRRVFDERPADNRRLDGWLLAAIREEMAKHEPIVALARSLKDFPRGRATFRLTDDLTSTLLPHCHFVRDAYHVLELDAELLVHAGRAGETADRVRAVLCAVDGLRDDPFIISLLGRMAGRGVAVRLIERILGMGELADADCLDLMKRLAAQRQENSLRQGIRGERAMYHRMFENMSRGGKLTVAEFFAQSNGNANTKPELSGRLSGFLYSHRLPEDHAAMLRWMKQVVAITGLPPWEQDDAWADFDAQIKAARAESLPARRLIVSLLFLPAVNKVGQADLRDRAAVAAAEAALAAERFRLANKRWPKALDELCPAYLAAVPLDPYTGEPLLYAPKEDGVAVYSVGPDLTDDGGGVLRKPKEGSHDIGFRLHDADKRNLPAEGKE